MKKIVVLRCLKAEENCTGVFVNKVETVNSYRDRC